jgi:hypothetical protein
MVLPPKDADPLLPLELLQEITVALSPMSINMVCV